MTEDLNFLDLPVRIGQTAVEFPDYDGSGDDWRLSLSAMSA